MSLIKRSLVIIFANIAVFLTLVSLVAIVPPLLSDAYSLMALIGNKAGMKSEKRIHLPNYQKHEWLNGYYKEQALLNTVYYDYIGWRRSEFKGKFINIDANGYRRHDTTADKTKSSVWLFGGSTMWGTGVPDLMTIPAYTHKLLKINTFNFGETAYTAHQNLNLLIKEYLSGGNPKYVVFYDGVNDVAHKCRGELNYYSGAREWQIRSALESRFSDKSELLSALRPSIEIIKQPFVHLTKGKKYYDCDTNSEKANHIARAIITDWEIARHIVESNGGVFIPILQPVAYIGRPNITHLSGVVSNTELQNQYISVYREIVRSLDNSKQKYYNLTPTFDGIEQVYIDFCHVTPDGNLRVAHEITKIINDIEAKGKHI